MHGQTTLVDPCRRSMSKCSKREQDDACEADQKMATVKYVVGEGTGGELDGGNLNVLGM